MVANKCFESLDVRLYESYRSYQSLSLGFCQMSHILYGPSDLELLRCTKSRITSASSAILDLLD